MTAPAPSPRPAASAATDAFAILANAALPAYTAFRYAQFAWSPANYDDDDSLALVALFIAQFPLALIGAAFGSVLYIEGPAWRRVLVYAVVVAVLGVASGLARFALTNELAPIIGYAIAMQLTILMFAGPQPQLAIARIEAVAEDSVNLSVLTVWGGFVAIVLAVVFEHYVGRSRAWAPITFEWSDVAWIGAVYFALRTWSAIYVYTQAFAVRRVGWFHRQWIERLLRRTPRSSD